MEENRREAEIIQGVTGILQKQLRPERILLFGSRATPKHDSYSDFDFAIDHPKPDRATLRKLRAEIQGVAGLFGVDLVFLPAVDESFRKLILGSGKVIYEKRISESYVKHIKELLIRIKSRLDKL